MLVLSDFWPPVTGGWRRLEGHLIPIEAVVAFLERDSPDIRRHPDFLDIEDDSDWQSFLAERLNDRAMPAPVEVLVIAPRGHRIKPKIDTPPGFYALWSSADLARSQALSALLRGADAGPPRTFRVWDSLRVPPGAGLLLLVGAVVGIFVIAMMSRATDCPC